LAVASLGALALAGSPGPLAPSTIRIGWTHGVWELPWGPQNGYVDGYFYQRTTNPTPTPPPVFHFTATLIEAPVACPSCIAGYVQGVLDDGVGTTPDYFVSGHYYGSFSNGSGTFTANIFEPTSAAPVGSVSGNFSDPPLLPVLGRFDGKWLIRR
jgi:hypothetical protein